MEIINELEPTARGVYAGSIGYINPDDSADFNIAIRTLIKKGERVGYDLTEKLARDSVLAIIPVGYWHGLLRSASNKAEVLVRGKRAKIVGRVCMDMCIIDVTGIKGTCEGDEVTLIGEGIPAEELAENAGTINYEVVTRVNPLLPRIFK